MNELTILRKFGNRFGDWLNVKDFGAKLDGVTLDTAAFNAARAAAKNGQTIYVPPGIIYTQALTADTTKQVRWMLDGCTNRGGGNVPSVGPQFSGDLVENYFINGGTKYFGRWSNPAEPASVLRIDFIMDYTTGTPNPNGLTSAVTINTTANKGTSLSSNSITSVLEVYADDS